ncbi:MAG: DoxX family protein [Acidimicrobiia bacterium]|nr:DoxX family protein [Acidimicrobiia bacterium]
MRVDGVSGTAIVQTLGRLVLAATFIPTGYIKLFTSAEYTAEQAAILRHYGAPVEMVASASARAAQTSGARQSTPGAGQGEIAPLADGVYAASARHTVTLRSHAAGWPFPASLADVASLTEFFGGILLLAGFLSRVWGLGLAIDMGAAFYLYSVRTLGVLQESPFTFSRQVDDFNAVATQLGLFTLALSVLLTGPGPLSVDRLLARRRKKTGGATR